MYLVKFKGELREEQDTAIASLMSHNTGVLNATTAFGKTVTAIDLIAKRKVNTLILVHTKALLEHGNLVWKSSWILIMSRKTLLIGVCAKLRFLLLVRWILMETGFIKRLILH